MGRVSTSERWALALVVMAALAGPAQAQSAADRTAIEHVIAGQIGAFRKDDGPAAFAYAAPDLQMMFGDAASFMRMVRQAYRPVYRPRSFAFGALVRSGGALVQRVELIGPDGKPRTALYTMEHEPDGSWRIAACRLIASEALGA
ncbi:MAG: DUF4864 domain-containing protein [Rhodospirillales bacterium]|nr:DUF4864 domain-containing protein [Rhodospirillales bacterium]MDE2198297.1 DUF4864 domain-containing protein [Rhodospirillales bacterium]MDE2574205.1 DUF4864 domain-containing protein [Rhodospirillales bacterium]